MRKVRVFRPKAKTSSAINCGCLLLFPVNFVFPVLRKNKTIIAVLSEEHGNAILFHFWFMFILGSGAVFRILWEK